MKDRVKEALDVVIQFDYSLKNYRQADAIVQEIQASVESAVCSFVV